MTMDLAGMRSSLAVLHDGCLEGLSVRGGQLRVDIRVGAKRFTLRVPGPIQVRADNFREGNIVLEVALHGGSACPRELVARACALEHPQHETLLDTTMDRVMRGKLSGLEILASYGCELVAVFGPGMPELTVTEDGTP